jgi:hypothetical protein
VTPTGPWIAWIRLRSDRRWRRLSVHPQELLAGLATAGAQFVLRGRIDVMSLREGDTPPAATRRLRTERLVLGASVVPGRRIPQGE